MQGMMVFRSVVASTTLCGLSGVSDCSHRVSGSDCLCDLHNDEETTSTRIAHRQDETASDDDTATVVITKTDTAEREARTTSDENDDGQR